MIVISFFQMRRQQGLECEKVPVELAVFRALGEVEFEQRLVALLRAAGREVRDGAPAGSSPAALAQLLRDGAVVHEPVLPPPAAWVRARLERAPQVTVSVFQRRHGWLP